ncbi:MAG TPA: sugar-binding domain-containing protein, partial [Actinopolymorphaceae bacterium]
MSDSCPIRSWEFRVVDGADHHHGDWAPIEVPGCWEDAGVRKDYAGPVDYRATIAVPEFGEEERVCVRFGAVSYACTVAVDGVEVGRHVGMWDGFEIDVTDAVMPGCTSELTVRVEKPASLTAGPDSEPVAGRYPTRQTLAGFLPYVWGHVHGGIWQDVELVVRRGTSLRDVTTWGRPDGTLTAHATVSSPAMVRLTVTDQDGTVVAEIDEWADDTATLRVVVPTPRAWSPLSPYLYTVALSVKGGESVTRRIGLREVAADGGRLTLNGEPLYPRMLLSWGWYPDNLFCNPGPDRVRADFAQLKRLGFNGVKLCLWFPPAYYFDIADEMGILLWVELPMWLPHPTEHFLDQLGTEVDRLVQASRDHTSVILYTLGCELSSVIGDDVLGPLYGRVKTLGRDALVRDNSGSGEAYGGLLTEYADFYDHHLYCEPQYFRETLEHFAPRWRTEKPWLFGEFCDLDTFRDLRRFGDDRGRWPWWTSDDPAVNPQGARWQYDVQDHER